MRIIPKTMSVFMGLLLLMPVAALAQTGQATPKKTKARTAESRKVETKDVKSSKGSLKGQVSRSVAARRKVERPMDIWTTSPAKRYSKTLHVDRPMILRDVQRLMPELNLMLDCP